ncbi:hypothetical protein LPMP_110520 [Leishmania panamensis]|uniref:Uncharacterized protein n=1 Tax=Leishmania panamensis TaxID=5679 RepID=A0A088RK18_LEIPA
MTQRQQMSAGLNSLVSDLGNQHQEAADATAALNGSISGLAGALAQAQVAVTETASNARGVVSDAGNHDDLLLATLKLQHETPPVAAQKTAQEVKAHPSPTRCARVWGCAGLRSSASRFGVVITTAHRSAISPYDGSGGSAICKQPRWCADNQGETRQSAAESLQVSGSSLRRASEIRTSRRRWEQVSPVVPCRGAGVTRNKHREFNLCEPCYLQDVHRVACLIGTESLAALL